MVFFCGLSPECLNSRMASYMPLERADTSSSLFSSLRSLGVLRNPEAFFSSIVPLLRGFHTLIVVGQLFYIQPSVAALLSKTWFIQIPCFVFHPSLLINRINSNRVWTEILSQNIHVKFEPFFLIFLLTLHTWEAYARFSKSSTEIGLPLWR